MGCVCGAKDLIPHIMDFYQSLFGTNTTCNMKLTWNFWSKSQKLAKREWIPKSSILKIMKLNRQSIRYTRILPLVQMVLELPFSKKFWHLIKGHMIRMFRDFHERNLDIQ